MHTSLRQSGRINNIYIYHHRHFEGSNTFSVHNSSLISILTLDIHISTLDIHISTLDIHTSSECERGCASQCRRPRPQVD